MPHFKAKIEIIGINPYVLLPEKVLLSLFKQAGKNKGAIPVKGKIEGNDFIQHLVKYSGHWRLYLNTPMRKASNKDVGDKVTIEIEFDPIERVTPMHIKLQQGLRKDAKAKKVFDNLSPSRQKEILRYINFLKTEESIERNVKKILSFLHSKERFAGRDKP
jgi:hypothetical protein